ncbi:hypothetical protein ABGT24_06750 [Peribacillus frigoritolerans]|uniref:hypothetical protein n=1 Tax=Peribacillus frigoritolerans TaxID=450367 RepID=UPI00345CA36D
MKKRFILFALVFALFTTTFTPLASAKQIDINGQNVSQTSEEDQIKQLAEDLEFLFEEAGIRDSEGNLIGFDNDILEKKFGERPELKEFLESSAELEPVYYLARSNDAVNTCFNKRVKKEYGAIISGAIIGQIITMALNGEYLQAAKKAVGAGVKGSVYGTMATMMGYLYTCVKNQ